MILARRTRRASALSMREAGTARANFRPRTSSTLRETSAIRSGSRSAAARAAAAARVIPAKRAGRFPSMTEGSTAGFGSFCPGLFDKIRRAFEARE